MKENYTKLQEQSLEDIHAKGTLLVHNKSGARIVLLENEDDNKVFHITFRTPPRNSTGVAHIIEHTVLCGSEKYPLKDPFVELAKGSLNTFLNAMTYPDKTMYPVASCNLVDFKNLMDVYLNAVFYPKIYTERKIFQQEGWHLHLEKKEDLPCYNGVVYNEMKGVFSTPEEILERTVFNSLFPDTPYGVESGGDPTVIPELSYEEFLDFHRQYYHPSNSYLYLYGNLDMEERLAWLDEHYLSHFDQIEVQSEIPHQPAFSEPRMGEGAYPILEEESEKDKTFLSWNAVVGDAADVTENLAFAILTYVLLDAPGAPIKQRLLDEQIGKSIGGSYEDGILQPFFSIVAQQAEEGDRERFAAVIREELERLVTEGLDQTALASGINYYEFRFREADYGTFPKGLIYGMAVMDSWLYDAENPFAYLQELAVFADLRKKAGERYFEALIRTRLLDNPHQTLITLHPEKGLAAREEQAMKQKMQAIKEGLSEAELDALIAETKALQAYQEEAERPEDLATIPLLSREDIAPQTPVSLSVRENQVERVHCLQHVYDTNGIGYLTLLFDTESVPEPLIPYLGLLKGVLGQVRTENYTYNALFHEINAHSGGISFSLATYPVQKGKQGDVGKKMLVVRSKYLYAQQSFVFRMIREILETSYLRDAKRMREIIDNALAGLQHVLPAAGHATAANRAMAKYAELAAWNDQTSGIAFYRFLENLKNQYEARQEEIFTNLEGLLHLLLRPENLTVSLTAEEAGYEGLEEEIASWFLPEQGVTQPNLPASFPVLPPVDVIESEKLTRPGIWEREAFRTSGQVQFVALGGSYRSAGLPYTGHLRVLKTVLSFDYLWMQVRVLGGAYGCMTTLKRTGDGYFTSFRDPHLKETLEVYRGIPAYLQQLELDERTMTKYIIGTISEMDMPQTPSAKGAFSLFSYFSGITEADLEQERREVLTIQPADLVALSAYVQAILDTARICVIGGEQKIEEAGNLFDHTEALVQI